MFIIIMVRIQTCFNGEFTLMPQPLEFFFSESGFESILPLFNTGHGSKTTWNMTEKVNLTTLWPNSFSLQWKNWDRSGEIACKCGGGTVSQKNYTVFTLMYRLNQSFILTTKINKSESHFTPLNFGGESQKGEEIPCEMAFKERVRTLYVQ